MLFCDITELISSKFKNVAGVSKPFDVNNKSLKEKEKEYGDLFANPYRAAARGFVDEVILPEETRERLIHAFDMLQNKVKNNPKKKHGNIPM